MDECLCRDGRAWAWAEEPGGVWAVKRCQACGVTLGRRRLTEVRAGAVVLARIVREVGTLPFAGRPDGHAVAMRPYLESAYVALYGEPMPPLTVDEAL